MRRIGRERGQGLIEFIVIFPFLMFFLFTILDVGVGLNRQATLQHAAREGARFASVYDNANGPNDVKDRVVITGQGLVDQGDITVSYVNIDGDPCNGSVGDLVKVDINYTFKPKFFQSALRMFGTDVADIDIVVHAVARLEVKLVACEPEA